MSQVSTCSTCGGDGKIITEYCKYSRGEGNVQSPRSVKMTIPAGVSDESTMRIEGEGNVDKKRNRVGDLYLVLLFTKSMEYGGMVLIFTHILILITPMQYLVLSLR